MSTVQDVYATQIQLVRKVRFDLVNELDAEIPWLPTVGPTRSFCFRARVGIDTGLQSSTLFNMIAQFRRVTPSSDISFRFYRPRHTGTIKKMTQHGFEMNRDGFANINLTVTVMDKDGEIAFVNTFSSPMSICNVDCECMTTDDPNHQCGRTPNFTTFEDITRAFHFRKLSSPGANQYVNLYAIFDIKLVGRVKPSFWSCYYIQRPSQLSSVGKMLQNVLETGAMYDIVLKVDDGEEFKAHMNILAGNSDVFAAMFGADMREKSSRVVEISDISSFTMRVFLKFLYYREVADIAGNPKLALDLLSAADKYIVKDLQDTCESILLSFSAEMFTVELALECYVRCHRLGFPKVESHAVSVLKVKSPEIRESPAFIQFIRENVEVVPNLFYLLSISEEVNDSDN